MKTKELALTNKVYDLYVSPECINFHPVNDKMQCAGFDTVCKEEMGIQAIKNKFSKFIVIIGEDLNDDQLAKILFYINSREKDAKVKATTISKVKGKPRWFLVEHSPRWSRNSVAHSILMTWVRYAFASQIDNLCEKRADDEVHLSSCFWLLDIIKKHGLRIFGTFQHEEYDVGMVSFMFRLSGKKFSEFYKEPDYLDYENEDDYLEDLSDWEDRVGDTEFRPGDFDNDIPSGTNAYTRLMKMHKEQK